MCMLYRYLLQYQEPIPCEQLVSSLCDIKQAYTQFGGNTLSIVVILYLYSDEADLLLSLFSVKGNWILVSDSF